MEKEIFTILTFLSVGIGFAATPVLISWILGWRRKNVNPPKELQLPEAPDEISWLAPEKYAELQADPYESGMPSEGPWRYIGFEYIIYVILFLVFDIIFVAIFFSLGAWLENPKLVTTLILATAIIGAVMIFYALKPRKYLRL